MRFPPENVPEFFPPTSGLRARGISPRRKPWPSWSGAKRSAWCIRQQRDEGVGYVCNCCGVVAASCGALRIGASGTRIAYANYYAVIEAEFCANCGNCIERCQCTQFPQGDGVSVVDLSAALVVGCASPAVQMTWPGWCAKWMPNLSIRPRISPPGSTNACTTAAWSISSTVSP